MGEIHLARKNHPVGHAKLAGNIFKIDPVITELGGLAGRTTNQQIEVGPLFQQGRHGLHQKIEALEGMEAAERNKDRAVFEVVFLPQHLLVGGLVLGQVHAGRRVNLVADVPVDNPDPGRVGPQVEGQFGGLLGVGPDSRALFEGVAQKQARQAVAGVAVVVGREAHHISPLQVEDKRDFRARKAACDGPGRSQRVSRLDVNHVEIAAMFA